MKLREYLRRQSHDPGLAGILVNPFYIARRGLGCALRDLGGALRGRLLDVGCGVQPYRALFPAADYVGLELDTPENRRATRAEAFYDGLTFPFPDGSYDSVLCNQVLEHVFEPDRFLGECRRVLRDGGRLLVSVPFVWDEHEQPRDFARYSSFGLRALLERQGFTVIETRKTVDDPSLLFQLLNAYLFKVVAGWPRPLRQAVTVAIMAPLTVLGLAAGLLPRNPDLYLDNVMVAEKKPRPAP